MTVLRAALLLLFAITCARAQTPVVDFPTENRTLATHPEDFYMYVQRDFEGEKSKPWQGGQYGFVRNPKRSGEAVIYTQLHEGVDIKPLRRDAQGNPLDPVKAAAAGEVVYVNAQAGASNYGRYVVVEHRQDGTSFYTLYAHLSSISVVAGQSVRQGQPLGIMGFTGNGIDRERAHVHFEVCIMLSKNFDGWHQHYFPADPNHHGLYNGLNLVGSNPARLLEEARKNLDLKISDFFANGEPWYKITVKNSPNFSLLRTSPWLVAKGEVANPPAWTVTFSRYGVPLKIEAAEKTVTEPILTWVKDSPMGYSNATRGLISGAAGSPHFTESGLRSAKLLTWPD